MSRRSNNPSNKPSFGSRPVPGAAKSPSRRDLLGGSLATVTVASTAALAAVPAEAVAAPEDRSALGYRETDHVRRFYALARR